MAANFRSMHQHKTAGLQTRWLETNRGSGLITELRSPGRSAILSLTFVSVDNSLSLDNLT